MPDKIQQLRKLQYALEEIYLFDNVLANAELDSAAFHVKKAIEYLHGHSPRIRLEDA